MKKTRIHIRALLFLFAFFLVFQPPPSALSDESVIPNDIVFVQVPEEQRSSPSAGGIYLPFERYVNGCRIVSLSLQEPNQSPVVLTSEFLSARDPSVSFDGRHILFAGKRTPDDTWQIWRMDRNGDHKEQITQSAGPSTSPLWVGSNFHLNDDVPTPQIIYVGTEDNWRMAGSRWPVTALYACNLGGTNARRITFNLLPDFDPDVLPNGRLVFSSWRPHPTITGLAGKIVMLAVNIDGTDLMSYGQEPDSPVHSEMSRAGSKGRVYYIENDHRNWLGGGKLVSLSQRRPLHSRKVLAGELDGRYHSPCPVSGNQLMVSFQPPMRQTMFGLYLFDAAQGKLVKEIYSTPRYHCLDAHVLDARPTVEGRSSVVGFKFKDSGAFYGLDIRISELPEIKRLKPGAVKTLRVIEGAPLRGPDRGGAFGGFAQLPPGSIITHAVERILGECPVEPDGSFHMRTPANTPLRFQLLDEQGLSVAEQKTWTWVRNGEARGCIGCHENREMVPPNVMAQAVTRPESPLQAPIEDRRSVDFKHDVFPIISGKCMACHKPAVSDPNLSMVDRVYLSMFHGQLPMARPGKAGLSPMIIRVLKDARTQGGEITPCAKIATDEDRKTLIEWIDLGCYYDTHPDVNQAKTAPRTEGGS